MKRSRHIGIRSVALAVVLAAGTSGALAEHRGAAISDVPQPWIELNGVRYHVQKVDVDGTVDHRFFDGVQTFTRDGLKEHLAAQQPQKITPRLEELLTASPEHEPVDVLVILRHQPASPISREVWNQIELERSALASAMREISARPLQRPSMPEFLERDFIPLPLTEEELQERRQLAAQLKQLETQARQEIFSRTAAAVGPDQDEVARAIAQLGGEITARISVKNIIGARLTPACVRQLAQNPLIAEIDFDHPGEPELDNSRLALMVDTGFWANNITGGVFNAGVLDTGVQMNHPALASHPFISNMGASDSGTHGTHVAGIMVSTDNTHRGMAFGADKIVFSRAGNDSTSMTGMNFIASTGEADVCNYSFGNGSASSNDYANIDRFFDGVISTFSYLVSKSTGNGGFGSGSPTITHPAPAFNLLACASIDDRNTPTRNDDWISSFSSRGPTAGGRKKPDIAAPGSNIISLNTNWQSNPLRSASGTSMAAPHVGAAVLLLYDMGVNDTKAAKAVLINTADAMEDNNSTSTSTHQRVQGSNWNRRYGWGYMHLGKAYLNGLDVFVDTVSTDSPRQRFQLYSGQMFQHEKATLVWERHVAYNGASYPTQISTLSDLDLFAYRADNGALMDSSTSAIDNVEQIGIPAGQQGEMVLKVKAIGNFDPGITEEEFALATQENFQPRQGPAFDILLQHPASAAPNGTFTISATLTNTGDLPAHDVTVTLDGVDVVGGTNPLQFSTMGTNFPLPIQWTVSAAAEPGIHPISISIISNSYGEVFSASEHSGYTIGPAAGEFLITNMPGNDGAQSSNLADGRIKAMGFTIPSGSDYTLDEVNLRLDIASLPTTPLVRIFSDDAGLPATSLITLDNPSITSTGVGTYAFTPSSTFILEEDTPYWLIVYNNNANSMHWLASSPPQIPSGIAVHSGSLWNGNTGPNPPVDPSAIINSYSIIGTSLSACYADCDANEVLNVDDFMCFINAFSTQDPYADCDGNGLFNIDDFMCFINEFAQGCP